MNGESQIVFGAEKTCYAKFVVGSNTIELFNLTNGTKINHLVTELCVSIVAVCKSKDFLICGGKLKNGELTIHLYDLITMKVKRRYSFKINKRIVMFDVNKKGECLILLGNNFGFELYYQDLERYQTTLRHIATFAGRNNLVHCCQNDEFIYALTDAGDMTVWNAKTLRNVSTNKLRANCNYIQVSPKNDEIFLLIDSILYRWKMQTNATEQLLKIKSSWANPQREYNVELSHDQNYLAITSLYCKDIVVIDVASQKVVRKHSIEPGRNSKICFSPCGNNIYFTVDHKSVCSSSFFAILGGLHFAQYATILMRTGLATYAACDIINLLFAFHHQISLQNESDVKRMQKISILQNRK